ICEEPIGLCGNSSDEELKCYYYFKGIKNKLEIEKKLGRTYLPVKELSNKSYSIRHRNIKLKIFGNVLTNQSINIFETISYLDTIYHFTKLYEFNKGWKLVKTKKHIEYIISKSNKLHESELIDSTNFRDEDGLKQGNWIQKMKNGNILRENNYLNGKKHGQQLEFYSNGDIRYKENYKNGLKEEYNFSYYKGKTEPFTVGYFENDTNLWMGFVEVNKQFIYPLKDFHINTDSIYVIAPYNNGNTWYEGAFLNPEQKEITGKRVGVHKVYFISGQLNATLDFDKKRITEYDTIGNILIDNDTFEKGTIFPTNYKK
ncbi:MAG: toxin-antitoxin system YwqK family antitoxin, partial [Flavobacteriales bacterium]